MSVKKRAGPLKADEDPLDRGLGRMQIAIG
jgi:hypothetical protein